jgi:hypothetical protein
MFRFNDIPTLLHFWDIVELQLFATIRTPTGIVIGFHSKTYNESADKSGKSYFCEAIQQTKNVDLFPDKNNIQKSI